MTAPSHVWRSKGEKRTITWNYEPTSELLQYLESMRDAVRYALQVAYRDALGEAKRIPSPIQLRREIRTWFFSKHDYARHHINPVCRVAVAALRSYKKNHHGDLRIPEIKKLAMRIDAELLKIVDGKVRITLQPNTYAWIHINTANKRYGEYSKGRPSELLITDKKVCLTFVVGLDEKPLGEKLVASDLNFKSLDMTTATRVPAAGLIAVKSEPLHRIVQIQNDFSRRRERLQEHIRNPLKRKEKLQETRGRERKRIKDALHKLSTTHVKENPNSSFIFENLKGIRRGGENKGSHFRKYLNRWPYRMYQSFVDYKSPNKTLYASPRGTSSECPVCGGKLEHPTWAMSRCKNCGVDYDRNRLASLAILLRGLRLCGQPFAVSADASWQHMRDEYLPTFMRPEDERVSWTESVAYAPNGTKS
jgi:putative transposase